MPFQLPKSKILKLLMGWMIVAAIFKIVYLLRVDSLSTERVIGIYLLGIALVYILGAFWSEFPFVYLPAMIAAAVFVIAVLQRGPRSKSAAKNAFMTIMYLSLFSIWVEPWITNSGLVTFVLLAILRLTTSVVDIGVTAGWLLLWALTTDEINRQ